MGHVVIQTAYDLARLIGGKEISEEVEPTTELEASGAPLLTIRS
jgi:hypothetical protein